jgi:hypothetical protein
MACYAIFMQWLSVTAILWHIRTSAFFSYSTHLWQHNKGSTLYLSAIKIIFLIKIFKWKPKYSVNGPAIHFFLRSKKSRIWAFTSWHQRTTAVIVQCNNGKDKKDDYGHQPITCKEMGKPFISWSSAEYTQQLLLVPKGYQRIASV